MKFRLRYRPSPGDLLCVCGHERREHAYVILDGPCGARSDGCTEFRLSPTGDDSE